jgi:hypothetical protein
MARDNEDEPGISDERCGHCDSREHRNCGLSFDDFMLGMKAAAVNAVHEIMARPTCADCDKRVAEDEVRCLEHAEAHLVANGFTREEAATVTERAEAGTCHFCGDGCTDDYIDGKNGHHIPAHSGCIERGEYSEVGQ